IRTAQELLELSQTEVDFSNMFLRGQLTHVSMLAIAMALKGMGLLGDDEERKRRARLLEEGIVTPFDITRLQNNWINSESYWVDDIPILSSMYQVTTDVDGNPVSPVAPAWWIRQHVDGFLGIARFTESG